MKNSPESLRCDLEEALVPSWSFFSTDDDDSDDDDEDDDDDNDDGTLLPALCENTVDGEGFLSMREGEGVNDGLLSRGDRAGLGLPSWEDGGVTERGVEGPLLARPFVSFSPDRWEAGGVKQGGLREGDEDDGEFELRRTWDAESPLLRQGIFSRLTTGSDTLEKRVNDKSVNLMSNVIGCGSKSGH